MNEFSVMTYVFTGTMPEILIVLFLFTFVNVSFLIVAAVRQDKIITKQKNMLESKEDFIKYMAAEQHEFNKHMQAISNIACQNSPDGLMLIKEYTEELISSNRNIGPVFIVDGVLSAYLTEKRKVAEKNNIQLSILAIKSLDGLPCSSTEVVEIVGNLLDNAIEAVQNQSDEKRKVFLEIGIENEHFIFQTMNAIPADMNISKSQMVSRGISTKIGTSRGHGLANVKTILTKYGGKLQINSTNDIIIIKAVI